MEQRLLEAHELTSNPQTPHEVAIYHAYNADLAEALGWLQHYRLTNARADLNSAW
jgi:hypothetical protein